HPRRRARALGRPAQDRDSSGRRRADQPGRRLRHRDPVDARGYTGGAAMKRTVKAAGFILWEAGWLTALVLSIRFFGPSPTPSGPGEDINPMLDLIEWMRTLPALTFVIWCFAEQGSQTRKLAAVAFGGSVALSLGSLLYAPSVQPYDPSILMLLTSAT